MTDKTVGEYFSKLIVEVCCDIKRYEVIVREVIKICIWIIGNQSSIIPKTCIRIE